jgi:hypothetical protein
MPRDPRDKVVYFVTTLRAGGQESRTVGYFWKFDDARRAVEENWGDIHEDGYYRYALIEAMSEGLYPTDTIGQPERETWYNWVAAHTVPVHDPTKGHYGLSDRFIEAGYQRCEKPDKFKRVSCWAVG